MKTRLRAMKEEYVSYECAKALKKLGYYWPSNGYYFNGKLKEFYPEDRVNRNVNGWGRDNKCTAPRLDQAQKWLRDVKQIDVLVFNCACGYGWEISKANGMSRGTTIALFVDEGDDLDSGMWSTYEKALSAGIDAALKLLEEQK